MKTSAAPATAATPDAQPAPDFLCLAGLSKKFGDTSVIHDLSLSIRKGEFVSLLGPSGCGKTTILRMIAGFLELTGGEIRLDGQRIDHVPSHRRDAAMVFQNYALFPHMTVAENVGFGLRMRKTPKPEIERRVAEALKLVRLEALGHRYPKQLSGGQQQRVALARAVVLKPKLLLLDEPLSNLDAKLRKELRTEFKNIHRLAGTTTIFVTHDLEEAFSTSDRVAVMNGGRVEQFADPATIFNSPATSFVAEFVGHSNIISGVIERTGDGSSIVRTASGTTFAAPAGHAAGESVRLAIPAHLIEVRSTPADADNCVPVKILGSSYLGASIHYDFEVGGIRLHAEMPLHGRAAILQPGNAAHACWHAADFIDLREGRS